jgi:Zn finger protein HypA/HybF involved in hydrogenase expression
VVDEYICEWCVFSLPYKHGENAAEGLTTPITPQSTTQGCNQCPHCLLKNGITVECPNCQEAIIQI